MNKSHLLGALLVLLLLPAITCAAIVDLGSTSISFTASGGPPVFGGTWSAGSMNIPDGATIEYFEVELTALSATLEGTPISITDVDYLTFFAVIPGDPSFTFGDCPPLHLDCIGPVQIGNTAIVTSDIAATFAWAFFNALASDDTLNGATKVALKRDGETGTSMGEVAVRAYGEPVPIPPSVWLFGTGLLGLIGIARRRKAA